MLIGRKVQTLKVIAFAATSAQTGQYTMVPFRKFLASKLSTITCMLSHTFLGIIDLVCPPPRLEGGHQEPSGQAILLQKQDELAPASCRAHIDTVPSP